MKILNIKLFNCLIYACSEHEDELKRTSNANLYNRQEKGFPTWFEKRVSYPCSILKSNLIIYL